MVNNDEGMRSLSELELLRQKHNLEEEGEFYTAIGPDGISDIFGYADDIAVVIQHVSGKEIILKRYLNDQAPELSTSLSHQGFLSMAMNHLKEKNKSSRTGRPSRRHGRRKPASVDGYVRDIMIH